MMGIYRSLEESRQMSKAVEERKAAVAASLGKTPEEFDREVHAAACPARIAPCDDADDEPSVDEEQVLAFIRGREKKIEALKEQIRTLKLENSRMAAKLDLSERKAEALRKALADVRAELAARKASNSGACGE